MRHIHTAPDGYTILRDAHGRPWAALLERSPFAHAPELTADEVVYLKQVLELHQLEREPSIADAIAGLGARIRVRAVKDELEEDVKWSVQQLAMLSPLQARGFDSYPRQCSLFRIYVSVCAELSSASGVCET